MFTTVVFIFVVSLKNVSVLSQKPGWCTESGTLHYGICTRCLPPNSIQTDQQNKSRHKERKFQIKWDLQDPLPWLKLFAGSGEGCEFSVKEFTKLTRLRSEEMETRECQAGERLSPEFVPRRGDKLGDRHKAWRQVLLIKWYTRAFQRKIKLYCDKHKLISFQRFPETACCGIYTAKAVFASTFACQYCRVEAVLGPAPVCLHPQHKTISAL